MSQRLATKSLYVAFAVAFVLGSLSEARAATSLEVTCATCDTQGPDPIPAHDFGNILVGATSATVDVVVTIVGSGNDITISEITGTDEVNFEVVDSAPVTLSIGGTETTTFTVACKPQSEGAITTATVEVKDDSTVLGSMTVDCTGVTPEIIVTPNPPTPLTFNDVAFGDGTDDQQSVNIANSGAATANLEITDLTISGTNNADFVVVTPTTLPTSGSPIVLAPGENIDVVISFTPSMVGAHTANLVISNSDLDEDPSTVPLEGDGIEWLRVTAVGQPQGDTIDFPDTPVGAQSDAVEIEVCNDGAADFDVTSVVINPDPPFTEVVGIPTNSTVSAGTCWSPNYEIAFAPTTAATFMGTVTFHTDIGQGVSSKAVNLSGTGLSVDYSFTPDPVDFGDVDITEGSTSLTVTFKNIGQASLDVGSGGVVITDLSDPDVFTLGTITPSLPETLAGSTDKDGGELSIVVDCDPYAVGSSTATLTVTFEIRPGVPQQAVVNLSVNGTSAAINLSANNMDFGLVDVDAPAASETVTVTNTGDADLDITNIQIMGAGASAYEVAAPTSPYPTIAPMGTQDITVRYDPSVASTGEPPATVVVTTNISQINIALTGEGIDRLINLTPRSIVFDDTYRSPAQPTIAQLDIQNMGRAPLNISMAIIQEDAAGVFSVRQPQFSAVGPLSTETVEVEFIPTQLQAAPYTGQLVIMNDDDNEPMAIVNLQGTAILPNIAVDPGEIDYGRVGVGVTSEVGLDVPIIDIVNLDEGRSFTLTRLRVVDRAGQPIDEKLFRIRGLEEAQVVQAGGRIGLEVEFNPSREGEFEFLLQVFAEADPLPIVTAPIRAEAVDVKLRGGGCQAGGGMGTSALLLVLAALAWLGRRRVRIAALALALGSLAVPASAQSTRNLEIGNFRPTLGAEADFVTVDTPAVGDHLAWTLGLGFNYSHRPLVVESEETSMTDTPVKQRTEGDLYASLAIKKKIEVGARLSLFTQKGDDPQFSSIDPAEGFAIGDVSLEVKVHVLRANPIAMSVAAFATAPTATDQSFAGAAGFSGGARAIAGVGLGRIRVGANLGYRIRENGRLADVVQGDELMYGVGASYLVRDELSVVAEIVGALGVEGDETGGISPVEGIAAVRYHISPTWGLVAGAGRGLVSGIGAPAARGFLLFTVSPSRAARRVAAVEAPKIMVSRLPNADDDNDGFKNKDDKCPGQPEDFDKFEDDDGCPEADNDQDGIVDQVDKCVNVPEDKDGHLDDDGCPDPDNDDDGIEDVVDKCPNEPEDKDGFQDDDGCDDFDNDLDGVPDLMDMCPKEREIINGVKDDDGCPDKGKAALMIVGDQLTVVEPISFKKTSSTLAKSAPKVLGQVVAMMRAHPEWKRVVAEVHVHPRGAGDQKLSDARAAVIKKWLLKHGVAEARLQVRGAGSSKPVKKSGRNAARFNDRVTFQIVERSKGK